MRATRGLCSSASLWVLLFFLSASPTYAQTATLAAGFPTGSIWASKTQATAGDSITLFAILYNSSNTEITGSAAFEVDGTVTDTKNFDLSTGSSQILSSAWTASVGTHVATAVIQEVAQSGTGQSVALVSGQAGTVTITVAPAPPPTAVQQAANTAATILASSTPALENAAQSAYAAAEQARTAGAQYFARELAHATSSPQGKVLGASTTNFPGATTSPWNTIWDLIANIGAAIFGNPLYFYPAALVSAFVIIGIFDAILYRIRRPRRR